MPRFTLRLLASAVVLALGGCTAVAPPVVTAPPAPGVGATDAPVLARTQPAEAPAADPPPPMADRTPRATFVSADLIYGHQLAPSARPAWLKHCVTDRDLDRPLQPPDAPMPAYTAALAEQGVHGQVRLLHEVKPDGTLGRFVAVNTAPDALVQLSLQAMQQWRFARPSHRGQPVTACRMQQFTYRPS